MKNVFVVALSVCLIMFAVQTHASTIYTFEFSGTVGEIHDGFDDPATLPDVSVGDSFSAWVTYDTSMFGPGVNVIGDGLDYAAPLGLQMTYQFSSGGLYTESISAVRARDASLSDQWNWKGGDFGGGLFQANDFAGTSFTSPLPTSFDDMHTLFLSTFTNFSPLPDDTLIGIITADPLTDRFVGYDALSEVSITETAVPEPSTIFLLGTGLLGVAGLARRRKS
ncbi:PEP-CTERM sorting domain-containing protein [Candidatus Moduliflexota bacterium]